MAAAPTLPSALRSASHIHSCGRRSACDSVGRLCARPWRPARFRLCSKKDWAVGFCTHPEEEAYYVTDVEGEIPAELRGTLFRNGPGRLDRGDHSYAHIFDGDGMLCAFAFDDGRLHFRNRFVRTKEWAEEEAADRLLHRNTFGTQPRGGWTANAFNMIQKNVANTHVVRWGGKLLALWEAAQPYALDPATLETRGIDTLARCAKGCRSRRGAKRSTMRCLGCRATRCRRTGGSTRPIQASARARRRALRHVRLPPQPRRTPSSRAAAADSELMIYEFDSAWAAVRRPLRPGLRVRPRLCRHRELLSVVPEPVRLRPGALCARRTPPSSSHMTARGRPRFMWCRAIRRRGGSSAS